MALKKRLVVMAALLLIPASLPAKDDKHDGKEKKTTTRSSAEKKKPSTLSEKISACLAERPGPKKSANASDSSPKEAETQPQSSATVAPPTKPSGEALFAQYCIHCHSGGLNTNRAIGKLTSNQMPPPDEPQPSEQERQALIEYFSSKK